MSLYLAIDITGLQYAARALDVDLRDPHSINKRFINYLSLALKYSLLDHRFEVLDRLLIEEVTPFLDYLLVQSLLLFESKCKIDD